jgi:hypothetical protein
MKHTIKIILISLLANFATHAQILNPGFELLNVDSTIQNWGLAGAISITIGDSIISDGAAFRYSTNAHSGNYALEMRNSYNYTQNTPYFWGTATANVIDTTIYQGFSIDVPINIHPNSLDFFYKLTQNPFVDSTQCMVRVLNSNHEIIANGKTIVWDIDANYKIKSVAINYLTSSLEYLNDSTPAFIQVHFNNKPNIITNASGNIGQRVLIDDVSINSNPLSIQSVDVNYSTTIFPNPVQNFLNIHGNDIINIEVINIFGQIVLKSSVTTILNLQAIPNGIYFLRIKHKQGIEIVKINKQSY